MCLLAHTNNYELNLSNVSDGNGEAWEQCLKELACTCCSHIIVVLELLEV